MKKYTSCLILTLLLLLGSIDVGADDLAMPDIQLKSVVKSYSDRLQFGNPTGIFLDPIKNEIYLADAGNHQIGIFDMRGTTLWSFKHWVTDNRTGQRTLGDPHSVVVTQDGDIIVSDNKADYLDVFDYRGNFLRKIDPADYDNIPSLRAAVLALDRQGNLYLGTKGQRSSVVKLNSEYEVVLVFGAKGDNPDNFNTIAGIWIDENGNILVIDALSLPVVKRFNQNGEYLGGFGDHTIEKNDFSLPSGIVTTSGGRIWIADQLRQVVKCVDSDGKFITMIGGLGVKPGDMSYPSAISSDGDSLLIVAEKNGNRFQQFVIR